VKRLHPQAQPSHELPLSVSPPFHLFCIASSHANAQESPPAREPIKGLRVKEDIMKKGFSKQATSAGLACALLLALASLLAASARTDDDVEGAPQFSDWSEPVNLGPVVNWPDKSDQQPAISKDGLSLYFASGRLGGFGDFDIYVSQRASVNDPWGTPQNLGPAINTSFREFGPALSTDGHSLYFASDRPGSLGKLDLYVSRRHNKRDDFGWQPPENLGSGVNTNATENGANYFEDETNGTITLYFQSDRLGGNDIYAATLQADGTFGTAVLVPELSSSFDDSGPAIRRDGLEIFLGSNRPGSLAGSSDLWVSRRANTLDPWLPPVHLEVVNSAATENRPALSFNGTELYFTSTRRGGPDPQDLYVATRTKLKNPD
jgi:hypothetical protein